MDTNQKDLNYKSFLKISNQFSFASIRGKHLSVSSVEPLWFIFYVSCVLTGDQVPAELQQPHGQHEDEHDGPDDAVDDSFNYGNHDGLLDQRLKKTAVV